MHIQTIGYPTFIAYPAASNGAWYWSINLAGSAEAGFRQLRMVMANADGTLNYGNIRVLFAGSGSTVHEYEGPDQTKLLSYATPIADGFSNVLKVGGDGSEYFGSFSFDLEIETATGSGIFEPLSLDNATYVETKAGTDFLEFIAPDPPEECFWTNLVRVDQVCE